MQIKSALSTQYCVLLPVSFCPPHLGPLPLSLFTDNKLLNGHFLNEPVPHTFRSQALPLTINLSAITQTFRAMSARHCGLTQPVGSSTLFTCHFNSKHLPTKQTVHAAKARRQSLQSDLDGTGRSRAPFPNTRRQSRACTPTRYSRGQVSFDFSR